MNNKLNNTIRSRWRKLPPGLTRFLSAVGAGALKGLKTGAVLLKIMIPVYAAVVLVRYSPLMPLLEQFFSPAMQAFQLPGEAVVPIIAGFLMDEYAVVAALGGFSFTTAQITTIAMFVLCFHSIPVESAISIRIGFSAWKFFVFRLLLAIAVGLLCGWLGGMIL